MYVCMSVCLSVCTYLCCEANPFRRNQVVRNRNLRFRHSRVVAADGVTHQFNPHPLKHLSLSCCRRVNPSLSTQLARAKGASGTSCLGFRTQRRFPWQVTRHCVSPVVRETPCKTVSVAALGTTVPCTRCIDHLQTRVFRVQEKQGVITEHRCRRTVRSVMQRWRRWSPCRSSECDNHACKDQWKGHVPTQSFDTFLTYIYSMHTKSREHRQEESEDCVSSGAVK